MIEVNYNESGFAWDFRVSSRSHDRSDTWCIPKKEFCSKRVARTAYGINDAAKAEIELPDTHVYQLRHGEDMALQAAFTRHCGRKSALPITCVSYGQRGRICKELTFEVVSALFGGLSALAEPTCENVTTGHQRAIDEAKGRGGE